VRRRQAITLIGGTVLLAGEAAYLSRGHGGGPAQAYAPAAGSAGGPTPAADAYAPGASYAPDGTAGRAAAVPRAAVRLLPGPFRDNEQRNLAYLLFLDPDRMLRSFRLNYGLTTHAEPLGGWESPTSRIRGHVTGHLLSALALAYAGTGTTASDPARQALKAKGDYLVTELAAMQQRAPSIGYGRGYLSGFPEVFFDYLESGRYDRVWSPYYMIHKYLAGLIDQYQLAGNGQALAAAALLGDWVDHRTAPLSQSHMQAILEVEFGGLPEALANLYAITGERRYLATARRFWHARFLDPLAAGQDRLAGEQCNISLPKVIAAQRLAEETGDDGYAAVARNFWRIATGHHAYVIGGQGNGEHWGLPDVVAGALSNYTCEGCVSYNMLKLTRLLHFHEPDRADLPDFYERALVNHLLGTQDPRSAHGFACYYTGLSVNAVKHQPLNYFAHGDPDVYATDYDTFTCDTATGLETPARFGEAIYARDPDGGLRVNQFISSEVSLPGLALRQDSGLPDSPWTLLTVTGGGGYAPVRVRVPGWADGPPEVTVNAMPIAVTIPARRPAYLSITRRWQAGDQVRVTFPISLAVRPAPDAASVAALSYGPVILAGLTGGARGPEPSYLPVLDVSSLRRVPAGRSVPLAFTGSAIFWGAGSRPVQLIPVARVAHQPYTVYWRIA
jgi:DUF1680 family protein